MVQPRAYSLPEVALLPFLQRQRRGDGSLPPPPLVGPPLVELLRLAARLLPCDSVAVFLDDPVIKRTQGNSPLTVVAAFGRGAGDRLGQQLAPHHGLAGDVYLHGRTLTGKFTSDVRVVEPIERLPQQREHTFLMAAVRLGSNVCGVLELIHRHKDGQFTRRDRAIVELVARSISNTLSGAMDVLRRNELALQDDLTNLYNARSLEPTLRQEIARARRSGRDMAVLFCDLDHLKAINDRFGHRMGSRAIQRVGYALRRALKGHLLLYRFGGDEFVVILPDLDSAEVAAVLAERARAEIAAIVLPRSAAALIPSEEAQTAPPPLSASIGVATYSHLREALAPDEPGPRRQAGPAGAQLAARLLNAADRALYRAKHGGRNRIHMAEHADYTQATL